MFKRRMILCMTAAAFATACGDDDGKASTNNLSIFSNASTNSDPMMDAGADAPDSPTDAGLPTDDAGMEADQGTPTDVGPPTPEPVEVDWPATPAAFIETADTVSYVSALSLPMVDPTGYPTCCRDFGEVSKRPGPDNALGSLVGQLESVSPDFQGYDILQASVEEGQVTLLLDHRGFAEGEDSRRFALSWLEGSWGQETSWALASEGGGSFIVDRDTFLPGSGEPRTVMNPVVARDAEASGGPTTLVLSVPVGFALVPVELEDVRFVATYDESEFGVSYADGELSGSVATADVFQALNDVVRANCGCLELGEIDLYRQSATGNWSGSCTPMAHQMCVSPDEEICRALGGANVIDGGYCEVLPQILQNTSDLDLDGDGTWESLSVGLEWSAVPATIE